MLSVTRFGDLINAKTFYKAVKELNGNRVYVNIQPSKNDWKVIVKDKEAK